LAMSAKLNTFMTRTQGKCGRCFVTTGRLLQHEAFHGCPDDGFSIPEHWLTSVKDLFKFPKFTYCWNCGSPQDRRGNRESPDCHRTFVFRKGTICPWADFIYVAIWTLWNHSVYRPALLCNFGLPSDTDYDQFSQWLIIEDALQGRYYNGLELYLWFHEQWANGNRH
jgi:hypothetical protein